MQAYLLLPPYNRADGVCHEYHILFRNRMADLKIDHNALASRFELSLNGGLAVLDYRIEGDTVFLLYVEVPAAEQGRGIAGNLSQAALEFTRDNGLKVMPRCPFIATYMRRHS